MSGSITFTGIYSGIDSTAIVEQLMEIERQPLYVIQDSQSETRQRLDIYQQLASRLSTLDSAIQDLNRASTINARSANSSNTDVLDVSATAAAATGSFSIDSITRLANSASEASIGVVDKEADFVSGTGFSFDVGSESVSITLAAGQNTLEGLRDAINSEASDLVSASVIDTGDANDPYKLVLRSVNTGADNDISNISTDITVTTSTGDQALSFVPGESVDAQDALFKLNGVDILRGSNTVTDLVDGVTLELKDTAASPVTVTVTRDTDELKESLNTFISAYNEVNSLIQAQFEFNEETQQAGLLSGDSTLRQIQSNLQSMVVGGVEDSDGNRYSLATIGVEIDKYTGDLSLDTDKFDEAAANEDTGLFFDLLLAQGVPSDSRVNYVSSSDETEAGTYGITITGYDGESNAEGYFSLGGENYTGVGDGQYLIGPEGSPVEGLRVRIDTGVTGDLGEIFFSVGVAEQLERQLDNYLTPITGLLPGIEDQLEKDIAELEDQITAFEERLAIRERELFAQFIEAEEAIASLQNQQESLNQQLAAFSIG